MAVKTLQVVAYGQVQLLPRGQVFAEDIAQAVDQAAGLRADDGDQYLGAAAVVVIQGFALDAHGLRHIVQRGVGIAFTVKQGRGVAQYFLAAQGGFTGLGYYSGFVRARHCAGC